jgi:hypothetical protein
MTHPLTAVSIHVEAEEAHLCHSANEVHREGPLLEMVSNERHACLIHKFPDPVSIKPLCFCQKRFHSEIIDHILYTVTVETHPKLFPPPLWGRIKVGGAILIHPHPHPPPSRGRVLVWKFSPLMDGPYGYSKSQ